MLGSLLTKYMNRLVVSALVVGSMGGSAFAQAPNWQARVDPWVLETAERRGNTEFLVVLEEQADLTEAGQLYSKEAKGWFVFLTLRDHAARTQKGVLQELAALGVEHRPFWVANMIWVRGDVSVVERMASRADVSRVAANPQVRVDLPEMEQGIPMDVEFPDVEPGIANTEAPEILWKAGAMGQGAVIGGQDTGYDWDHPALVNAYRGMSEDPVDHDYNWHDSIHTGGGSCGSDATEPCDDSSHGTHTMGTMVGFDGGTNWIGMAPAARWIGCRNMDQGNGTPATYAECFQWFIAPTRVDGSGADASKAPHVINNSWSCPPSEGCTDPLVLKMIVDNTRAAGILVAVSAGNSGSGCSSVSTPAAIYDSSFTVGATNNSDVIASFSSRGPVTVDGSGRLKPDISAPGVSVRSSVPGGGYSFFSGTSMAGPHVAGMTALLVSAAPCWAGEVDTLEQHMIDNALPRTTTQECGGVPGSDVPNNTYGYGAMRAALPADACEGYVHLSSSPWVRGQPGWMRVTGANPGDLVRFYVNLPGPGIGRCFAGMGGICLDLRTRARGWGTAIADDTGTATRNFNTPNRRIMKNVYLQAIVDRDEDSVKTNLVVFVLEDAE